MKEFIFNVVMSFAIGVLVSFVGARWAYRRGLEKGSEIALREFARRVLPLLARSGIPWEIVEAVLLRERPQHRQKAN